MKNQLLLLAGVAVIFASCGSNNNNPAQTQAQIDSTVNAKMAQHDAENAAKNDSTLKAMEKEKAEAMSHEHHEAEHHHEGTKNGDATPSTPAPAPAPPSNPKDSRFGNGTSTTTQQTVNPQVTTNKADRFNK